jgi:RNA polymerase sigma factor (sigma-70 family)
MDSRLSDAEVVRRSVAQPALFSVLYERHLRAVGRYVARRVGTARGTGPAEDLAAEVFVRAFRVRDRYRVEQESALPWLLGIANNLIADHWRAERRRLIALERMVAADSEIVEQSPSMLAPDLVRALLRLPAADRDALLLVVWGELSYEEAASALGVPVGTIRSRIARARGRLADAIGAAPSLADPKEPAVNGEARA